MVGTKNSSSKKNVHGKSDAEQTSPKKKAKLVGAANFVRNNPMSDRFNVHKFHYLEFYTADATNTASRFSWGLGMKEVARSDHSTNNHDYCSIALQSNDLRFVFTAPYNTPSMGTSHKPNPHYDSEEANKFIVKHGMAVKAVALLVDDAALAYRQSVAGGGISVMPPTILFDEETKSTQVISEVNAYGQDDVVIRYVSGDFTGPCMPNYKSVDSPDFSYGLQRLDHCVGNVPELLKVIDYVNGMTGFHEFAEFTAEDVGTVDSGLNSMVMASNNELVLMPINEPTFGTKRKSQIQTYLEQNHGAGVQHLALKTDDIFETMTELRKRSHIGGFQFMPRASDKYYKNLPNKIGNSLTAEQLKKVEELGLLADKDDQGVLLQVFTKPVGDRPTLFLEIIQRVGCDRDEKTKKKRSKLQVVVVLGREISLNFLNLLKSMKKV